MTRYYCTSCNYQFLPKTAKVPERCPYCDKLGTVQKAQQVQDLIDEVSDMEEAREERN